MPCTVSLPGVPSPTILQGRLSYLILSIGRLRVVEVLELVQGHTATVRQIRYRMEDLASGLVSLPSETLIFKVARQAPSSESVRAEHLSLNNQP